MLTPKIKKEKTTSLPNDTDNDDLAIKKEKIDTAGLDKPKRKSLTPSKKELLEENEKLKATTQATIDGESMKMITEGLWKILEGTTGLPFMQVNPVLLDGWNNSAVQCYNFYLSPILGNNAPLFQLGTFSILIVIQALDKKKENESADREPKKAQDSPDNR